MKMTTPFDQGEFDFDAQGTDENWKNWQRQNAERKRAFENRWGVILGKHVIITLKDFAKPSVGLLHFEERKNPQGKLEPVFRIGNVTFVADDIISIVQE